jgi:hypothetical protein
MVQQEWDPICVHTAPFQSLSRVEQTLNEVHDSIIEKIRLTDLRMRYHWVTAGETLVDLQYQLPLYKVCNNGTDNTEDDGEDHDNFCRQLSLQVRIPRHNLLRGDDIAHH